MIGDYLVYQQKLVWVFVDVPPMLMVAQGFHCNGPPLLMVVQDVYCSASDAMEDIGEAVDVIYRFSWCGL